MFVVFYVLVGLVVLAIGVGFIVSHMESAGGSQAREWIVFGHKLNPHFLSVFRNAVLLLMLFIVGTAFYSGQMGLSVASGIYFSMETITSLGYGDTTAAYPTYTGEWVCNNCRCGTSIRSSCLPFTPGRCFPSSTCSLAS